MVSKEKEINRIPKPSVEETRRILICNSHRSKIHGGGCCSDKGSNDLLKAFQQKLQSFPDLSEKTVLQASPCMSHCRTGITVKVLPDSIHYGKVKEADIDEIIETHLIGGKPVKRLVVKAWSLLDRL